MRRVFLLVLAVLLSGATLTAAQAQQSVPGQSEKAPVLPPGVDRGAIEQIVREYLLQHPEIIGEAILELRRRQEQASADQAQKALADRRKEIFSDPSSPVGGNPKGDVTIVEFFDYHCPYCKQLQSPILSLLKEDHNVRIVYKELPILAPESRIAAAGALAAVKQGKYAQMHNAMMGARGLLTRDRVLSIAKEQGLDTAKLAKDMDAPDIGAALDRNLDLAGALDISGTPAMIIGDQIVPGAVDLDDLRKLVAKARKS